MEPSRLKSFAEFVDFLTQQKFPHSVDRASQVVELPSKAAPLPGNLLIKWNSTVPFIQIIHFMVENVPEARIPALEAALVRLNNLYEVAGFGFDHGTRRLYYRLTAAVLPNDGISPTTLNTLGTGCVQAAKEFLPAFETVLAGRSGDEMEAIVTEMTKNRPSA